MKTRINLTIDEQVAKEAKYYAEQHNTSVSEMVQEYLKSITAKKEVPSLIQMIRDLKRPVGKYDGRDLVKEYYEAKGKY